MAALKKIKAALKKLSAQDELYLSYCSVAKLHPVATQAIHSFLLDHQTHGLNVSSFENAAQRFKKAFATLLKTSSENISFCPNTATGINQIAWGYPLEAGDRVITYAHEYPSNYYPWLIATRMRGAVLDLLPDVDPTCSVSDNIPRAWSLQDLEKIICSRTRVLAISHVQYVSGFSVDLSSLGSFCSARGIDLVVDATQSMGSLPLYPEKDSVSAVVASGCKWLMGPVGSGVMYTSRTLREKLNPSFVGSDSVAQRNYLDLSWNPHTDARCFEYSTLPMALVQGITAIAEKIFLPHGIEAISEKIRDYRQQIVDQLDPKFYDIVDFPPHSRSSFLTVIPQPDAEMLCRKAKERGLILTQRAGYLRIAPHFTTRQTEIERTIEILNSLAT